MVQALEKLYLSGLQFLIPLTPEETYIHIIDEAKKLTTASYGTILLMKDGVLTRVYSTLPVSVSETSRQNGFSQTSFEKGEPLVIDAKDVLPHHPDLRKIRLQSSVMVPLSYSHHTLGVLVLALTKKVHLTKKQLQTLKLFGAIASLSIRKTQLYSEATQALAERDLFISMASHELRTPLTAMNVYTHLLRKKLLSAQGPEVQWIEALSQEMALLIRLVNELLNVDLIKTGKFTFQKQIIDMHDVITRSLAQFQTTHPYYTVTFRDLTKGMHTIIEGDMDKIAQVLQNVLDNAAKFSPVLQDITITLSLVKRQIVIHIVDKGIGVLGDEMLKTMFYKEEGNYKEGMGLGLYISKIIMDAHNGSIDIRSGKRQGSVVTLKLPSLRL